MNLITNPASQIGVLIFANGDGNGAAFAWSMIGVIELVAMTVEFALMRGVFGRMYRREAIDESVSVKRTILMVVTANLASFVLGGIIGTVFAFEAMVP